MIAGAGPFGETYEQAVRSILDQGATPIIFQSEQFASGDVVALYRKILAPCPKIAAEFDTRWKEIVNLESVLSHWPHAV